MWESIGDSVGVKLGRLGGGVGVGVGAASFRQDRGAVIITSAMKTRMLRRFIQTTLIYLLR